MSDLLEEEFQQGEELQRHCKNQGLEKSVFRIEERQHLYFLIAQIIYWAYVSDRVPFPLLE